MRAVSFIHIYGRTRSSAKVLSAHRASRSISTTPHRIRMSNSCTHSLRGQIASNNVLLCSPKNFVGARHTFFTMLTCFSKVNFVSFFRSAIVAVVAFGSRTCLTSFTRIIIIPAKKKKNEMKLEEKKRKCHKINIFRLPAKHFIFPY